jgi:hypothetical protein
MIDFSLTEEQLALREMLQKFTKNEILPVAAQYDREGEFAMDIVKKAYDLQIMNASVPEAYGGGGMGCIEDCILHEELSYGCSGVSTCIMTNLLAMAPVLIAGSEEQKQQFLKPICTGPEPQFVSFCLTEPEAGSDVGAVATTAVLEIDEIPDSILSRLMSVRAYDAEGMMLDADVIAGQHLRPVLQQMLDDDAVAFLHLHNAKRGCYAARVERVV